MSMGLASEPAVLATFDCIVALVRAMGGGITMRQLGAAHAAARELQAPTPDHGRLGDHAHALCLGVGRLT